MIEQGFVSEITKGKFPTSRIFIINEKKYYGDIRSIPDGTVVAGSWIEFESEIKPLSNGGQITLIKSARVAQAPAVVQKLQNAGLVVTPPNGLAPKTEPVPVASSPVLLSEDPRNRSMFLAYAKDIVIARIQENAVKKDAPAYTITQAKQEMEDWFDFLCDLMDKEG